MAQLQHQHPDLAEDFVSYHDQLLLEGQARGERIGEERATRLHEARLKRERERVARERERAAQERERATQQQRELLLQLATQRFGPPADAHRLLVGSLNRERAHNALSRLLSANGWDDLLR